MRTPFASRTLLILAVVAVALTDFGTADFGSQTVAAFAPRRYRPLTHVITPPHSNLHMRGGASRPADYDEDEYDEEDEDEDEEIVGKVIEEIEREDDDDEEEEEEERVDPKLTASAMKSAAKAKAKAQLQKKNKIKQAVNARFTDSKPVAKASKKSSSLFKLPYIVKALLNPLTVFAMTKSYWISLFNLEYPPKESNQDLRSSIEEKNRNVGPSSFKKPKRKFKRGQAKTLSDLPQLNT